MVLYLLILQEEFGPENVYPLYADKNTLASCFFVSLADDNIAYSVHLDGLKSLGLLIFWSPIPQRLKLGVGLLKLLDYMRDSAQHTEYYFTVFLFACAKRRDIDLLDICKSILETITTIFIIIF